MFFKHKTFSFENQPAREVISAGMTSDKQQQKVQFWDTVLFIVFCASGQSCFWYLLTVFFPGWLTHRQSVALVKSPVNLLYLHTFVALLVITVRSTRFHLNGIKKYLADSWLCVFFCRVTTIIRLTILSLWGGRGLRLGWGWGAVAGVVVTWCFTPSQPIQLYHGNGGRGKSCSAWTRKTKSPPPPPPPPKKGNSFFSSLFTQSTC